MHYQAMLVGDYLKAAQFGTGNIPALPTYTIARVVIEKLESMKSGSDDDSEAKLKTKGVIYFKDCELGWVINRTNAECLAAMWGVDTDAWIHKRVTLFAAAVKVGGKMDIGIRIKGSPDLDRQIVVQIKLPKRKPTPMTLVPTGNGAPSAALVKLKDAAKAKAMEGTAALTAWLEKLSPGQRGALGSDLLALQNAAREADAGVIPPDDDSGFGQGAPE